MGSVVRLIRSVLILSLLAALIAPLAPAVPAQEPGTPEPVEEFQALDAGTGSLRLIALDEFGGPLDGVGFSINGDTQLAFSTGWQGTPGESLVEDLAVGSYTVEALAPPDYSTSGPQTVEVPDGGTGVAAFTLTYLMPTPTPTPDTTAPTAYFLSPQTGDTLAGTVTISAFAEDDSGVAFVRFEYSLTPSDLGSWVTIATDTDGTDGWSGELDTTAIPDGPVTIRLYADDIFGSSRSTGINVTIANPVAAPQLQVVMTATNAVITVGETVGFEITVTNTGDAPANDVMVVDELPFGMVWSIDAGDPGCEIAGNTLVCEIGTVAAGEDVTIGVTGATSTDQCGVLENTATVSASNAPEAADSASVTIQCPDLNLVVAPSAGVINAGDTATFTMTVTNNGPGSARGVIVNGVLQSGYWTIGSDAAVCTGDVGVLECALDSLAPDASLTIVVSRPTSTADCGVIMNTASVAASNEPGYQLSNNQSTGEISIICPSGIQVTLLDENNDLLPGGCFELWETVDGTEFSAYLRTLCDDSNGVTRFTDVPGGSYIVRQSSSPSMYPRMGHQVVTVTEGELALVTFTAPLGGKVTATFLDGAQPVINFHVGIYTDNGSGDAGDYVQNGIEGQGSDPADGTITIDNLPVGDYVLTGFHFEAYLSPPPVPFSIVAGEETAFDVPVHLGGSIRLVTTDAESDATILGACFRLYADEARTDIVNDACDISDGVDDGVNVIGKLTTGTYYWEQLIAAPNYIAGQTGTVEVTLGQETIVPVENTLAGSIVVTLLDEQGEPLPQGYFRLERDLGDGARETVAYACDSCDGYPDGVATFNGIPAGDYIVVHQGTLNSDLLAPEVPATVMTGQATPVEMVASVTPPPPGETPVANQDNVTTPVGQAVTISVLANDTDADTPVEELTVALLPADGPAHGTVALDATDPNAIVYTPNPGFFGVDSFYYEVSDGSNVATGAVRITVVGELVLDVTSFDVFGAPAPGRCFELWTLLPDDSPDRVLTVECDYNGDGMTTFTSLGMGRVLLRGYDAPDGMEPIADLLVNVGPGPVTAISINYELAQGTGAIVINATDGADPLTGACWELTRYPEIPQSGHVGCDAYDDAVDGQTRIYWLDPSVYTLRQRTTPAGHVTAADQSVEIVAGQVLTLAVPHATGDALRINTVHEDGSTILGMCMTVENAIGEGLTSTCDTVAGDGVQDGTIVLPVLPAGDYTATIFGNPSPHDYLPIRFYSFSVDTDGTVDTGDGDNTVVATYRRGGTVLIHIVDEGGQPLSEFTCLSLYHAYGDGSRGANIYGSGNSACAYPMIGPDDTLIIDDVRFFGLAPGNYVIGIGWPSNGYTMTDTPLTVTAAIVNEITVTLSEQAGSAAWLDAAPLDQYYAPITSARLGQTIQIEYTVINNGSTPLTDLTLTGDLFGVLFTLDTLEPDYSGRQGFNQPYVITAADAARGSVSFTTTLTTNELAPIVSIVSVPVTAAPNTEEPGEPVEAAGGTGATLTFTGIQEAGFTAVTPLSEPPAEELPGAFSVEGALFFEISTTATFNGSVLVCIPYETGSIPNARLLHFDDGAWVDITSVADSSDGLVCGITDHFSPFAIVELLDGAGPVITTPEALTAEATSATGATVTFQEPTAVDTGSGLATLTCSHASGDTFALGTTTVSCTATDNAGNSSSASFTITVQDTTAPVFAGAAPITVEATSPSGAAVTFVIPTATDLVSGLAVVTCNQTSGATFPIGTTTVTCTAEDGAANAGSASFTITVQTTLAPTNKNQCKNNGWKRFNNPFFFDQGSCVAYLAKKK
jgi:uncharacterized repeat protein (TIGR01451 family)